jgi:cytochrome c-type biogenesis protein CcmH
MLLAVVLMLVTLVVVASVVTPLVRKSGPAPARAAFDRAVYRAQLAELERDMARGVIKREEQASARLEVERRLLASASEKETTAPPSATGPVLAVVLALAIPSVAALVYLSRGSPGLPDRPVAAASSPAAPAADANVPGHADFAAAVVKLEQQLKEHPEDTEKWLLLARSQAEIGNWQKSADAYRKVIDQNGANAEVYAGYGEMLVMLAQGVVTPAARTAFESGLKEAPTEMVSRFYLALGDAQAGNVRQAIEAWQKLAADLPADSNMREEIKRRIDQAAQSAGIAAPALPPPAQATAEAGGAATGEAASGTAPPGPTAQDMAAAQNMSPEDRLAMIRSMVGRLAERLKTEPNDLDGWLRLGRAYGVLGQRDDAIDAYQHADKLVPAGNGQHGEIAAAIAALKAK